MMKRNSSLIIILGVIIIVVILFTISFGNHYHTNTNTKFQKYEENEPLSSPTRLLSLLTPKRIIKKSAEVTTTTIISSSKTNKNNTSFVPPLIYDCDSASSKSTSSQRAVKARRWALVVGIPSVDRPASLERRQRQRATWFRYSSVYSTILPRYLLGLHPSHDYKMSEALVKEIQGLIDAERSDGNNNENNNHQQNIKNDIIVFDLKEGKPATDKTVGGKGYWGLESEVGMSRKAYFWYCHAVANYVNADFFAKADDDLFLRSNIVASILHGITNEKLISVSTSDDHDQVSESRKKSFCSTHNRLYWGRVMKWGARKGDAGSKFPFVGGMFILMSRPLVRWIASSPIPAANSREPFHGDKDRYKQTNHDHEDVMVGRWLYDAKLPVCVLSDPRFHDVHVGANLGKVRSNSIGMHHLTVEEYSEFMNKFADTADSKDFKEVVDDTMKKVKAVVATVKNNGEEKENLWHGYAKVIGL